MVGAIQELRKRIGTPKAAKHLPLMVLSRAQMFMTLREIWP